MARRRRMPTALPTIWHAPDEFWNRVEQILLELDPPNQFGRKRIPLRPALDGVIYRMRTGCQWNHLPKDFGDDSSVHRTFQRWEAKGILDRLWALLVEECEELGGVNWEWQSADCALGKARFGGIKSVAIPRIEANRAPSAACSSRPMAAHWPSSSRRPTYTTPSC